jgi:hypothetical protein
LPTDAPELEHDPETDAATVMMDAIARANRTAPLAKRQRPLVEPIPRAEVPAEKPAIEAPPFRLPILPLLVAVAVLCCLGAIAALAQLYARGDARVAVARVNSKTVVPVSNATRAPLQRRATPAPRQAVSPKVVALATAAPSPRATATPKASPSPSAVLSPRSSPSPAATPSPERLATRKVWEVPARSQQSTPVPSPVASVVMPRPQSIVRSEGAVKVFSTPACTGGDVGISVSDFSAGCTNYAMATSGTLRTQAGGVIIVPVAQLGDPNNVQYALLYFQPSNSNAQYFAGVLAGNGSGHLTARIENGVIVEKTGDSVKYSTYDGRQLVPVSP